ncbi:unnamed protein product, partial [Rotaria magnacalcarata]
MPAQLRDISPNFSNLPLNFNLANDATTTTSTRSNTPANVLPQKRKNLVTQTVTTTNDTT